MIAPRCPSQPERSLPSHGLWSLWDMLKFNAADFYEVTTKMQHTATVLKVRPKKSVNENPDGSVTYSPIKDATFLNMMVTRGEDLKKSLIVLGASITTMAVDELNANLKGRYPTYEAMVEGYQDIAKTLQRELTQVALLSLNAHEREWFTPAKPLFGLEFENKFRTKGIFELDEGAKCLALGRSTAAVFHLMRLMEVGIEATRKCLGIPDAKRPHDRTWGNILTNIKDDGIKTKWPTAADRMKGDGAFFEALHATLDAVKNPLRDTTMHVANIYTDAEAEHIFALVKGFMMKLASRCDENGLPLA
jgi:hypothetical protein